MIESHSRILSINLAVPRPIATRREDGGLTGINKVPTTEPVSVTPPGPHDSGLAGDKIFLKAHGGPDQAVYAYSREEYDWWESALGRPLRNGLFGENLTTIGIDVDGALVGEQWRIGDDLILQATGPRIPCVTFQAHMGEPHWVKRFAGHGRPGTYLRVVSPGIIRAGDEVTVLDRPAHGVTITRAFLALTTRPQLINELLNVRELPESLRSRMLHRLGR
jgi:MOSC domain-containing protein YiiM